MNFFENWIGKKLISLELSFSVKKYGVVATFTLESGRYFRSVPGYCYSEICCGSTLDFMSVETSLTNALINLNKVEKMHMSNSDLFYAKKYITSYFNCEIFSGQNYRVIFKNTRKEEPPRDSYDQRKYVYDTIKMPKRDERVLKKEEPPRDSHNQRKYVYNTIKMSTRDERVLKKEMCVPIFSLKSNEKLCNKLAENLTQGEDENFNYFCATYGRDIDYDYDQFVYSRDGKILAEIIPPKLTKKQIEREIALLDDGLETYFNARSDKIFDKRSSENIILNYYLSESLYPDSVYT